MKNIAKGLVGVAVSAFFIWLTLRGKDLGAMWQALKSVHLAYLVVYLLIQVAIHLLRTVRWGILLKPLDPTLTFKRLNGASAAGFMGLIVLPFRLGEVARPMLIDDGAKITFAKALPSIVVERVVDGIAMTVMLLGILPFVPTTNPDVEKVRVFGWIFFGIFGSGGLFLAIAYFKHDVAVWLAHKVWDPISPRITDKILGLMESFVHGLKAVPSASQVVLFFVLTAVYWGINGIGLGIMAKGFDIDLSVLAMFTTMAVLTVGVMIPAGPGMVGIFQYSMEVGLKLFLPVEVVKQTVGAYANVVWASQFLMQVVLGLVVIALGHVDFGKFWNRTPPEVEAPLPEVGT